MQKIKFLYAVSGWGMFFLMPFIGFSKGYAVDVPAIHPTIKKSHVSRLVRPMHDPHKALRGKPYKKGLKQSLSAVSRMGSASPSSKTVLGGEMKTVTPTAIGNLRRKTKVTVIDNSLLPAFPPIADQGDQNSCVAFSTTYYVASHEACLVRNCNNATASENILSPSWTYNFINDGVDEGSSPLDALNVLIKHGAPFIQSFPYVETAFKNWDVAEADWMAAIAMRSVNLSPITITNYNVPSVLNTLKQYLFEGHVVSTGIDAGVLEVIWDTDVTFSDGSTKELGLVFYTSQMLDHEVTIVGYDDGATFVNPHTGQTETGLLKVANSWGSTWNNEGFFYMTYSSLFKPTFINSQDNNGGYVVSFTAYAQIARPAGYVPDYLVKATFSSSDRSNVSVNFGNNVNKNTWASSMFCTILNAPGCYGADLEYNGNWPGNNDTRAVIAPLTFVFDLTDYFLSNPSLEQFQFYISNNKYNATAPVDTYTVNLYTIELIHAAGKIVSQYTPENTLVQSPLMVPLMIE